MTFAHMSWCTGEHDEDGRCSTTEKFELGETAMIVLAARPCNYGDVELWIGDPFMFEPADVDTLIERLTAKRTELEAAIAETDCDLHEHPEDE